MYTFVRLGFGFIAWALVDVSHVVVRLLAVLPWFAFILAVVAGVVLQLAAGRAASSTEQDKKHDRVGP